MNDYQAAPQTLKSQLTCQLNKGMNMEPVKQQQEDTGKILRNTIRMRRWLIIGGIAVGAQALLNAVTRPESSGALIFHSLLALGCIGYGLSMTPRIRRLSQSGENQS
ncbi:hypothetical protein J2125_002870 [Erwinia toletana]|uniref:Uncharacterized protein n=1 Tax=Winslowiella toletana TaxID=92490 RepID=A0ABS4PCM7_9GAMM|nr:hypothetical protein [Winslowiella toletana]MBP2169678.1 hypothetical protein [Winslowiella toletana]